MLSIGEIRELASHVIEDAGCRGIFPVPIDQIIGFQQYELKGL